MYYCKKCRRKLNNFDRVFVSMVDGKEYGCKECFEQPKEVDRDDMLCVKVYIARGVENEQDD